MSYLEKQQKDKENEKEEKAIEKKNVKKQRIVVTKIDLISTNAWKREKETFQNNKGFS